MHADIHAAVAELEEVIAAHGLAAQQADLVAQAQLFGSLECGELGVPADLGASKFGGFPDLPEGAAWPTAFGVPGSPILADSIDPRRIRQYEQASENERQGRKMVFLAQIRWADLPVLDDALPRSGWAFVFLGLLGERGIDVVVIDHDGELKDLRPTLGPPPDLLPESVGTGQFVSSRVLHPRPRMSLRTEHPGHEELAAALSRLGGPVRVGGAQVPSYRNICESAGEECGGDDWSVLLQIDSSPDCGVVFGGGPENVTLTVAIRRSALKRRDFSQLYSEFSIRLAPSEGAPRSGTEYFQGLDLAGLWADEEFGEEFPPQPASAELVAIVEDQLGFRLPRSYVALMKRRNGGRLGRTEAPVWSASDQRPAVWIEALLGIGNEHEYTLAGESGSMFTVEEWEYPPIGVYLGPPGHDNIALDYRYCGREGEPQVVHVDQDDWEIVYLAPDFETFVSRLRESTLE